MCITILFYSHQRDNLLNKIISSDTSCLLITLLIIYARRVFEYTSSLLRKQLDKRDCMRRTGKTFSGHRISCRPEYYEQMAIMTKDDHNTYTRSRTCLAMSKLLLMRRIAHNDLTTTADGSRNVKWFLLTYRGYCLVAQNPWLIRIMIYHPLT